MPTFEFLLRRARAKSAGELLRDGPAYAFTHARRRAVRARYRAEFALRSSARPVDPTALRDELARAESVLVLCHGNVCRSPLAAELLSDELAARGVALDVGSAGLHATEGNRSPRLAREVAREYGVDLSDHRARPATDEDVGESDVVFLMDGLNYHSFRRQFPGYVDRAFLLGTLGSGAGVEIPDPYRNGRAAFERAYEMVAESVEEVAELVQERRPAGSGEE